MKTPGLVVSVMIAASAFLLPVSAMAGSKAQAGPQGQQESTFPMKAGTFKRLVGAKIEQMKGHLQRGLAKRSLSHEQKAEVGKAMDSALKDVHAAVAKAGADGIVTKSEAKQVKKLSEVVRERVRGELRGKHASAKGKGGKPAKGKAVKKGGAKKHAAPPKD